MIAILFFHTEAYYTGTDIIPYSLFVENALCIFFFISGYLFYRPDGRIDVRHKLHSIFRGLVMPYFIFTFIISVPKALVHGSSIASAFIDILAGRASWFVSALIVAELLFLALLRLGKGRELVMAAGSALSFVLCIITITFVSDDFCVWNIDNAFLSLPLLYFGWSFHRHEYSFERINSPLVSVFLLLAIIVLKAYECLNNLSMCVEPIRIDNWLVFIADAFVSTLLMVILSKGFVPAVRRNWLTGIIEWTGSHSLVYYFFCGAVPFVVSAFLNRCGVAYHESVVRLLAAFILVFMCTSLIAWIVYRFFPFAVGRKKSL